MRGDRDSLSSIEPAGRSGSSQPESHHTAMATPLGAPPLTHQGIPIVSSLMESRSGPAGSQGRLLQGPSWVSLDQDSGEDGGDDVAAVVDQGPAHFIWGGRGGPEQDSSHRGWRREPGTLCRGYAADDPVLRRLITAVPSPADLEGF